MRPLFGVGFILAILIALEDAQVGGAGVVMFAFFWLIGGRTDAQIENVGPSVGALVGMMLQIVLIGVAGLALLVVLGGGL